MNSVAGKVTQVKRLPRHLHRLHLTEASDGDASEMRWDEFSGEFAVGTLQHFPLTETTRQSRTQEPAGFTRICK